MSIMKNIIKHITCAALSATLFVGCDKNEYLPPEWNYDIPETALKAQTQLGAIYHNKVDLNWASAQGYTPVLNLIEEDGEVTGTVPYTSTQDGILTRQCEMAEKAGIDFFIFNWNAGETDRGLISAYEFYRTGQTKVKVAINYNFGHLHLTSLTGVGADFDKTVEDFKTLYTELFSKEWYYRMPDGRPVIIVSGNNSETIVWAEFLPAFRTAMSEFTALLQETDPDIADNCMDFYIIGENTTNWVAPQVNEATASCLDGNYVKNWYPSRYYERWYCFHSFTDMAWENWRSYTSKWKNDFIPCIYPEYYTVEKGARSIERSEDNFIDFCNVAKRNIGSQNIIIINSWNDFTNDTALEPTTEYGEMYLELVKEKLKL